mmetsp:Transcript_55117/g.120220  ORF Transcript_55117/g.120220 Transcript_55117/m.120220 type:complete len:205 (+) Transcript_55117:678-1292(+)
MTASATASAKLSSEQSSAPRTKSASSSDFASEASVFINSTPGAEGAAAIQAPELSAASGSGSSVEKPVPNREFSSVRPAHFDRTHAMSDNGAFDGNAPARSATTLGSSSPAEVISCCGAEAARIPPAVAATRTSVVPSLPTIAAPIHALNHTPSMPCFQQVPQPVSSLANDGLAAECLLMPKVPCELPLLQLHEFASQLPPWRC